MIFLSAGHHFKPGKPDPGAIGNGYHENDLTKELRGLIANEIAYLGGQVIMDRDPETLGEYIARIKPGTGSVVCEIHFNASDSPTANGTECIYRDGADMANVELSRAIASVCAGTCGFTNRGAKSEVTSHRGRLAILHTAAGLSCLPEICFITNKSDIVKYQDNKKVLAKQIAKILVEFDATRS